MIKFCKIHGETDHAKRKNLDSYRCRKCLSEAVIRRRKHLHEKALELKGNKCQICGYKKCKSALEFHHINSNNKEFGISDGRTRKWDLIVKELEKCILLCANCHREIHQKL